MEDISAALPCSFKVEILFVVFAFFNSVECAIGFVRSLDFFEEFFAMVGVIFGNVFGILSRTLVNQPLAFTFAADFSLVAKKTVCSFGVGNFFPANCTNI